jgi:hypothetical protein
MQAMQSVAMMMARCETGMSSLGEGVEVRLHDAPLHRRLPAFAIAGSFNDSDTLERSPDICSW